MITTLYVDNFRCLVNFEVSLTPCQLWLGDNGTGKTSVLDVLRSLQRVIVGNQIEDIFSSDDLTAWQTKQVQTFRVAMKSSGDLYEYELLVDHDHDKENRRCRIQRERLTWNGEDFYRFDGHEAHLFRVNYQTGVAEEGTSFNADWSRSLIPSIAERDESRPLVRFRNYVACWLIVQPIPSTMRPLAETESHSLARDAGNFADWYRHLHQEESDVGFEARKDLMEVLAGFQSLDLKEAGDARRLVAKFRAEGQDFLVTFGRLSDGQRQLILLYVILNALKKSYSVLFIDEPDNFVSLREIQPWALGIRDACSEREGRQAIVVSHHPEIVNTLTDGSELWFHRPDGSHSQVKPYPVHEGLTAAETLARGWDDG
ncbi:MAG: ATP-binding protein [Planctomycetota bacterium]